MGKKRIRNWIINNEFFQKDGKFSKSAFIMMNTWFAVMLKYLVSGFSLSYTKAAVTVGSITIPASNVTYNAKFDYGEAIALLTLVFGLYFGNKFAPNGSSSNSNGSKQADLVK